MDQESDQTRGRRSLQSNILKTVRMYAARDRTSLAVIARRSGMSLSSVRKLLGVGKSVTSGAHLVPLERLIAALGLVWELKDPTGRQVGAGAPPQSLEDLAASLGVRIEITPINSRRRT